MELKRTMTYIEDPHKVFYQKLGELFFAIAAADKVVRPKEFEAFKKIVLEEWKDLDDWVDDYNSDAAYQMEIVFEWFDYKSIDAQESFDDFAYYFREHKALFTERIVQLIWKTANAIAGAFAGKNKSELIMLTNLKLLLQTADD